MCPSKNDFSFNMYHNSDLLQMRYHIIPYNNIFIQKEIYHAL